MRHLALSLAVRLIVVFAASLIVTRSLIWMLPGDPIDLILAESGTSLDRSALAKELGLDRSYLASIGNSFKNLLHGDLGLSIHSRKPVSALVAQRLATTAQLIAIMIAIAASLSLSLGLLAARPQRTGSDRFMYRVVSIASIVGASSSSTWVGPLLLFLFTFKHPLFSVSGSLFLGAITLSIPFVGFWSRLIRDRAREAYRHPSVTVALSRGAGDFTVLVKYVFVPISGSLIAFLMTQIGHMLSGAFITEYVFNLNGAGSLLIEAVLKRDYPVIEGAILVSSFICIAFTLTGEIFQKAIDPRLLEEGSA